MARGNRMKTDRTAHLLKKIEGLKEELTLRRKRIQDLIENWEATSRFLKGKLKRANELQDDGLADWALSAKLDRDLCIDELRALL